MECCGTLDQLRGGDSRANAKLIRDVFEGKIGEHISMARDLIVANAAAAILVGGLETDFAQAAERATESIHSGSALEKLEALCRRTNLVISTQQ